jgi:hypothetical protein
MIAPFLILLFMTRGASRQTAGAEILKKGWARSSVFLSNTCVRAIARHPATSQSIQRPSQ